jgi:hypothetical protein
MSGYRERTGPDLRCLKGIFWPKAVMEPFSGEGDNCACGPQHDWGSIGPGR